MPDAQQTPAVAPTDDLDLELESAAAAPANQQEPPRQIPEKYKGKSVDDLIEMHQNAERRLSQQGNELGEIRRLADQLIGVKAPVENARNTAPQARQPVTVEALLANPDQVLNQTVEQSPIAQRAQAAEAKVDQLEQSISQTQFVSKYTNFQKDLENPDFIEWVKKSPLRTQLAAAAYKNNFNAASSLWQLWEERNELVGNVQTAERDAGRQQRVQNARTEKNGSSESPPARTYSRAKLMALRDKVADGDTAAIAKWNDPDFQAGLIKAYEENRVR